MTFRLSGLLVMVGPPTSSSLLPAAGWLKLELEGPFWKLQRPATDKPLPFFPFKRLIFDDRHTVLSLGLQLPDVVRCCQLCSWETCSGHSWWADAGCDLLQILPFAGHAAHPQEVCGSPPQFHANLLVGSCFADFSGTLSQGRRVFSWQKHHATLSRNLMQSHIISYNLHQSGLCDVMCTLSSLGRWQGLGCALTAFTMNNQH